MFHGALLLFVQQLPLQAPRQRLLHAHRARSAALGVVPHLRVALPDLTDAAEEAEEAEALLRRVQKLAEIRRKMQKMD